MYYRHGLRSAEDEQSKRSSPRRRRRSCEVNPWARKILLIDDVIDGSFGEPELDQQVISEMTPADRRRPFDDIDVDRFSDDIVDVFFESFPPPPTLIIFGAVHVAQPLTTMAKLLGFRVVVVDVRNKLATRGAISRCG